MLATSSPVSRHGGPPQSPCTHGLTQFRPTGAAHACQAGNSDSVLQPPDFVQAAYFAPPNLAAVSSSALSDTAAVSPLAHNCATIAHCGTCMAVNFKAAARTCRDWLFAAKVRAHINRATSPDTNVKSDKTKEPSSVPGPDLGPGPSGSRARVSTPGPNLQVDAGTFATNSINTLGRNTRVHCPTKVLHTDRDRPSGQPLPSTAHRVLTGLTGVVMPRGKRSQGGNNNPAGNTAPPGLTRTLSM